MILTPAQIYNVCWYLRDRMVPFEWGLIAFGYFDVAAESIVDIETRIFRCPTCGVWRDLGDIDTDDEQLVSCQQCLGLQPYEG